MSKRVLSIVPRLPPAICGVGETALSLAGSLKKRTGLDTAFVTSNGNFALKEWDVLTLRSRSAEELSRVLRQTSMAILHFVGYGYSRRGCPFWLVNALSEWAGVPNNKLIVIFHELYATGPVWTSAFWLSYAQRSIACRLAKAAKLSIATRQIVASQLLRWGTNPANVRLLPVFSTVGEIVDPPPASQRQRRLIVFGGATMRARAYACSNELARACKDLEIDEILDIGPPLASGASLPTFLPVRVCGVLPVNEISARMRESVAGFVSYYRGCLSKSSIFAAYASHGLAVLTNEDACSEEDGLEAGVHYFIVGEPRWRSLDAVASFAHAWYSSHRLEHHSATIERALFS